MNKTTNYLRACAVAFAVLGFAAPVLAHPAQGASIGFLAGFAHPLSGFDHCLALLTVGLLASQQHRRTPLALPMACLGATAVGVILGAHAGGFAQVELGILTSLVVCGALLLVGSRIPMWAGAALIAGFALFHGYAHGERLDPGVLASLFTLGVVLASALLPGIGAAMGHVARHVGGATGRRLVCASGAIVSLAGIASIALQ